MDFQLGLIIAGLVVGFIVGLTGVGGGSLMTPILLWFGIPPTTAVGTDLLYAAFTKMGGVYVHHKKKNINWTITGWLSLGSVPAALVTLWILNSIKTDISELNAVQLMSPTVLKRTMRSTISSFSSWYTNGE